MPARTPRSPTPSGSRPQPYHAGVDCGQGGGAAARPWTRAGRVLSHCPMASENIVEVTDANFKSEILESQTPVLVDFWATWCAPCRAIAPALEELATQYKGKVRIVKMNIDDNQDTPQQFQVRSIPTLLLFKGGRVVEQIVGAVPKTKLEEAFKKVV